MKYKLKIYEFEKEWYWSITDEYGDEIGASNEGFVLRDECRTDGHAAFLDFED